MESELAWTERVQKKFEQSHYYTKQTQMTKTTQH